MDNEDIKKFVRSLDGAVCDYPFEDDFETFVMRHGVNKKWFGVYISAPSASLLRDCGDSKRAALIHFLGDRKRAFVVCLKCDPELSTVLQQNYAGIIPAYHMNKRHWISVVLCADVPDGQTEQLITLSYDITAPRAGGRRARKEAWPK